MASSICSVCRAPRALRDVVTNPPEDTCDLALLLKSIPCLDQQAPDAAANLLRAMAARSRWLVVSFPTQSLGGHGKGMARTYQARFDALCDELGWSDVERIELAGELVFVVAGDGVRTADVGDGRPNWLKPATADWRCRPSCRTPRGPGCAASRRTICAPSAFRRWSSTPSISCAVPACA